VYLQSRADRAGASAMKIEAVGARVEREVQARGAARAEDPDMTAAYQSQSRRNSWQELLAERKQRLSRSVTEI
jgi:hypothetical protein